MTNYPDTTYEYDPRAPWNAPNDPECLNVKCCATLDIDWSFCPFCGTKIDWEADEYRNEVH